MSEIPLIRRNGPLMGSRFLPKILGVMVSISGSFAPGVWKMAKAFLPYCYGVLKIVDELLKSLSGRMAIFFLTRSCAICVVFHFSTSWSIFSDPYFRCLFSSKSWQLFRHFQANNLLPWKLTCPLKINGWKMYFLLKEFLFRGHVSFRGCTFSWVRFPFKPWGFCW